MSVSDVGAAYDRWAEAYVERFGEPGSLAFADRELVLGWAAARTGPVLDAGCGPGTWAGLLAGQVDRPVVGLDLSRRFVAMAKARHPGVPFVRASVADLPVRSGALDGVLAWYSLIHTPPDLLPQVLRELRRVLRPGGSLVVGFVDGVAGQAFAQTVATAYSWSAPALGALLDQAGFAVQEEHRRQDEGVRPHGALVADACGAPSPRGARRRDVAAGTHPTRRSAR